jgi:hypothetical protein
MGRLSLLVLVRLRRPMVILSVRLVLQLSEDWKVIGPDVGENLKSGELEVLRVERMIERVANNRIPGVKGVVDAPSFPGIQKAGDVLKELSGI